MNKTSHPSSKELLCTLGPASMNDRVIARLEELGANLFRINLSHTKLENVASAIEFIQKRTTVPVCLDSEGAQIRTGAFAQGEVVVRENSILRAHKKFVLGDAENFHLYPDVAVDLLEEGDFISIDFNSVLAQVLDKDENGAYLRILNGGKIGSNKAVTVERDILLPVMTHKDQEAFKIGRKMNIRHVALSFAHRATDVDEVRRAVGDNVFLISKIECRQGLLNLQGIASRSDAILIDRGDLSREEPLERIPRLQKGIISTVKKMNKKVYVATNLLESMITEPKPTRAEVNDVINTLMDGADGLVLAAETAIGKNPIGCASMIMKLIHEYESAIHAEDSFCATEIKSFLVEPHGGKLIQREIATPPETQMAGLKRLAISESDLMDCEQIAQGTYSPLTGFMDKATFASVVETNRLPDGTVWTMPILLQVSEKDALRVTKGERVVLTDAQGQEYAFLQVSSVEKIDLKPYFKKWFGADTPDHPGVSLALSRGNHIVSGDIELFKRLPSPFKQYQLTPAQSRFVFMHKGWSRVVGFHTRNVIHRAHEYIQLKALEIVHADGLYVSPVIGPRKKGDFLPEVVLKSYRMMVDLDLYPSGKVLIGSFSTYPRFCGPREAVFTALCRKNMGCSHFIIGRNHSGVGNFYADEDYKKLFDSLGDIGVLPVFFEAVGYDTQNKKYDSDRAGRLEFISGTQARETILQGQLLPDWYLRMPIQEMLMQRVKDKEPVFDL